MTKKVKLNAHYTKVWGLLYPIFASDFLFGDNYEKFAEKIAETFDLTPEQWGAVLREWEFKEKLLSTPTENQTKIF